MSELPNLEKAKHYFQEKLTTHGATPRGVDWNSVAAQELRFDQLIKVIPPGQPFSLLDYGCGYAALADYLLRLGYPLVHYTGYDILESMVAEARQRHPAPDRYAFTARFEDLTPSDFSVASGIFNIKLDASYESWTRYVTGELEKMNALSQKGFSFNMLTKYSDAEYMRPDLYYADPCFMFDYCKRHFSRNVALLHDYEAYDFTMVVRKAPV